MTDDQERNGELSFEIRSEAPSLANEQLNGRSSGAAPMRVFDATTRFQVVDRDKTEPQSFNLSRLWLELCAGTWRFCDTFSTEKRYFAVVERVSAARPLRARHLAILERVLLGETPKAVGFDLRIAISTVAGAMQASMKRMGLPGRLSSAPVMLTMAACAAHRPGRPPMTGRMTPLDPDGDGYFILSVKRPDLDFPVELSDAETAVVRHLVAGHTHAQISGARSTSLRTVANQLATAFRKFGVSGRGALVQRLIAHSIEHHARATYAPSAEAAQHV